MSWQVLLRSRRRWWSGLTSAETERGSGHGAWIPKPPTLIVPPFSHFSCTVPTSSPSFLPRTGQSRPLLIISASTPVIPASTPSFPRRRESIRPRGRLRITRQMKNPMDPRLREDDDKRKHLLHPNTSSRRTPSPPPHPTFPGPLVPTFPAHSPRQFPLPLPSFPRMRESILSSICPPNTPTPLQTRLIVLNCASLLSAPRTSPCAESSAPSPSAISPQF